MRSWAKLVRPLLRRKAPAYQMAVGGHWDDVGQIQCDFLVRQGLRPNHLLLDVGCGSCRGGRFFIEYLQRGHYCGIDRNTELLRAAKTEVLKPAGLLRKDPQLVQVDLQDEPTELSRKVSGNFDYVWAHALFDHIPPEVIRQCLREVPDVMTLGGRLYATIFLNPHGPDFLEPLIHPRYGRLEDAVITYPDREYWHHTLDFFRDIAANISALSLVGCHFDYPHPLGLRVLEFIRQ
jgi:SAM-dependent methyltransferase